MKHRSLVKVFVLHIVTLGLYFLYWLIMTRRDMLRLGVKGVPSVLVMLYPLLALIGVFILSTITNFLFTPDAAPADGSLFAETSLLQKLTNVALFLAGAVSVIAALVVPFVWTWRYSKGIEQVTGGKVERDYAFWLWILLWFFGLPIIWQLVIQNAFNKIAGVHHASRSDPHPGNAA